MILFLKYFIAALIGYLLGNISCANIMAKAIAKTDIRTLGSGNAGATNILRNFGLKYAVPVFFGDAIKAAGAAILGYVILGGDFKDFTLLYGFTSPTIFVGGIAAIIGHNFPVFMGFRGGKGVACSLGLLTVMNPCLGIIFIIIAAVLNLYIKLYSLVSMSVMLASATVFTILDACGEPFEIVSLWFMFLLMVLMHRSNIMRLIKGEEKKVDIFK
jgi:glycerol-3-phosphate acyltransferase PlsY